MNYIYSQGVLGWRICFPSVFIRSLLSPSKQTTLNDYDYWYDLIPGYEMQVPLFLSPIFHYCFHYLLYLTPSVTVEWVLHMPTWYWICLYRSIGCMYCLEPGSGTYWVRLAFDWSWMHICNDHIDMQSQLTTFGRCHYPYWSIFSDVNVRQLLSFPNPSVRAGRSSLHYFSFGTVGQCWEYWDVSCNLIQRETIGSWSFGVTIHSIHLEYVLEWCCKRRWWSGY